jgi:hypothetical protein
MEATVSRIDRKRCVRGVLTPFRAAPTSNCMIRVMTGLRCGYVCPRGEPLIPHVLGKIIPGTMAG